MIALLVALPVTNVVASNSSSKNFAELVWGDGTLWSMVAPPSPIPHQGASQGQEDFYEEAPQGVGTTFPASPQSDACEHLGIDPSLAHSPCFHDHTLGSVPGDTGFRALWHVFLVVCTGGTFPNIGASSVTVGSSSCTSGPVTGHFFGGGPAVTLNLAKTVVLNGTPTPLTSGGAVEAAVAAGVVVAVDTGETFICPVQAFSG